MIGEQISFCHISTVNFHVDKDANPHFAVWEISASSRFAKQDCVNGSRSLLMHLLSLSLSLMAGDQSAQQSHLRNTHVHALTLNDTHRDTRMHGCNMNNITRRERFSGWHVDNKAIAPKHHGRDAITLSWKTEAGSPRSSDRRHHLYRCNAE